MSDWTSLQDIRKKLEREWEQGKLLGPRVLNEGICPKRFVLKKPRSNEWVDRWDDVRKWAHSFNKGADEKVYTIEWKEVNFRLLGKNSFPNALVFAKEESILKFIDKLEATHIFDELCAMILGAFPELKDWLAKYPLAVLTHQNDWPRLLAVLVYLQSHPRPGIYVRQLEIVEVHTKFIEKHKKLLGELLDIVLPEKEIDASVKGVKGFTQRYGFLSKPVRLRFRILDPEQYLHGLADIDIPIFDFSRLQLDVNQVFITENEINGLAFPLVKKAIVIFGLGFGLDRLRQVTWLVKKKIYYWGDIDTHGFVMLDQLRSYYPDAASFLMDKKTLLEHEKLWGREERPSARELQRLTVGEQEVYEILKNDLLAKALRLEQERISFSLVCTTVKKIGSDSSSFKV